ncbi:MAG: c-type cytochrome [Saprospiraceae bacterium]|nr:c-type cytochrome [Saprospiraceae bacterium]
MRYNTKLLSGTTLLLGLIVFSAYAFAPTDVQQRKGTLQVLPKDISHDDLFAIMKGFEKALNVGCGDCHAKSKTNPKKLDFASEENPHKEEAREMMRMMMKINKKYFNIKGDFADNYLKNNYKVTCYSCHHGSETPPTIAPPGSDEHHND